MKRLELGRAAPREPCRAGVERGAERPALVALPRAELPPKPAVARPWDLTLTLGRLAACPRLARGAANVGVDPEARLLATVLALVLPELRRGAERKVVGALRPVARGDTAVALLLPCLIAGRPGTAPVMRRGLLTVGRLPVARPAVERVLRLVNELVCTRSP